MRIVSWNINSLRKRQDRLLLWLRETNPDVVCLQETKCTDEQFPQKALRDAGYAAVFHGQKSYNGVAILAQEEPREVRIGFCDEVADEQARVIAASVGGVRVVSIYAPNGQAIGAPAYDYKLAWYERLTKCLREKEGAIERIVVGGDYNVAPNDADVHDPALWRGAIMCSEKERAAFRALCAVGLADTLRLRHPEAGIFSWWDYRMLAFPKNRGLRIDAVLAGRELAAKCTAAGVDREMRKGKDPSDHAPVWAEFAV
ncbi:MAG TPA: exodeoxyribonuclease III [Chthoniobacterales bacterium]|nr:exodeoxyribonuclease III [Chthoniobacterales bacterium]